MTVISSPSGALYQLPPYPVRKFTVDEYHRMIQMGLLTEDDRVELLEGWIVPKMTHKPPHDGTIELAQEALGDRLPSGWRLRIQSAVTLADSEPEPDLAVVRGPARSRLGRHPGPADIPLVVEVADTTLTHDRNDKGRMYARAGIVRYWIINLVDGRVEVYSDPTGPEPAPSYQQRQDFTTSEDVPLIIDGNEVGRIPVRELLP